MNLLRPSPPASLPTSSLRRPSPAAPVSRRQRRVPASHPLPPRWRRPGPRRGRLAPQAGTAPPRVPPIWQKAAVTAGGSCRDLERCQARAGRRGFAGQPAARRDRRAGRDAREAPRRPAGPRGGCSGAALRWRTQDGRLTLRMSGTKLMVDAVKFQINRKPTSAHQCQCIVLKKLLENGFKP